MGIFVNDIEVTESQINAEVQYHPASSLSEAKHAAARALVIRELLIQRAIEVGLCDRGEILKKLDETIEKLLEKEITIPQADDQSCRRYFENNKSRFYTHPLFEVSHILYAASPTNKLAYQESFQKAHDALDRLNDKPDLFETIALEESHCSSAQNGGYLGQITKGQTTSAFESALISMKEGDISQPVASEFGHHIIKVHKRVEGRQMPYDMVYATIHQYLHQKSWNQAFCQYIQLLAGRAIIQGFELPSSQSPLVQ